MFHLVNARITFHNIFGTEESVRGVQTLTEENGRLSCILDEDLFEPFGWFGYDIRLSDPPAPISSSDDDIFRWTMDDDLSGEASSRDHRKVDIYEALNVPRAALKDTTPDSDTEEQLLQRYIVSVYWYLCQSIIYLYGKSYSQSYRGEFVNGSSRLSTIWC